MISTYIDGFFGLGAGETDHWAFPVTKNGTKIWNKTLTSDEAKLVLVCQILSSQGTELVIVEQ